MATADVESIADDGKVPAEARPEPEVNKLFRMVMKHEGSDLHMKVGLPPMMRLRGIIRQMEMKPLSEQEMERLLYPIISEHHRKIMEETGGADFAHIIVEDECRFRVNVFNQRGYLVFGTLYASSAPSTTGRVLDLFPADLHAAMRQSLAFNLKAIICQKLLPSIKPGIQRVPAMEIMIINTTIRDLIIKGEDKKLSDAIKIGFIEGMIDFTESLTQLVQRGEVDRAAALEVAPNPEALRMGLKGINVSQPGIL